MGTRQLRHQQERTYTLNKSYAPLTTFAKQYADNEYKAPKCHLKIREQYIITIHKLLSDGKWRTSQEISKELGNLKKSTVQHIIQAIAKPFAIASGQQGYCIPNKNTVLIV